MTTRFDKKTRNREFFAGDEEIVFRLDLAGNITFINACGERLIGYTSEEVRRLNVLDLLPGSSLADVRALAKRSIRQRFGTVFEIEITIREGRRVRLEMSIDPIRRADGTLEFHGIALLHGADTLHSEFRPRCLDRQFAFQPSSGRRSRLALDSPACQ